MLSNNWTPPDCGTIIISNPKTLQRWIDLGWYQEMIDDGYVFNVNCGRFRESKCTCSACRNEKMNKPLLSEVLKTL